MNFICAGCENVFDGTPEKFEGEDICFHCMNKLDDELFEIEMEFLEKNPPIPEECELCGKMAKRDEKIKCLSLPSGSYTGYRCECSNWWIVEHKKIAKED